MHSLAGLGAKLPFRTPSSFALVGLAGILVNQAALYGATEKLGIFYLESALLATLFSTTFNFALIERWVFRNRIEVVSPWPMRLIAFFAVNYTTGVAIRIPVLLAFGPDHYLVGNFVAICLTFGVRYFLADRWIWGGRDRRDQVPDAAGWYNYDIHGLLEVRSVVSLPELAVFRVADLPAPATLTLRCRSLLGGWPRPAIRTWRDGGVVKYREQLGLLGAAFDVAENDGQVDIVANWLLAWSNHVLYTNMIEPLLRFMLAADGRMLLHGASLDANGGIILSAKTDTGKTSTVLRLLAARRVCFLGDDMVIIEPNGRLLSFAKPMTLSSHTISSVPGGAAMNRTDRIMLALRSKLHSKEGRTAGHALSRLPVPIVTINAWVQLLVPPPKYHVESLLPCEARQESDLRAVVLMDRGPAIVEPMGIDELVDELIINTDDAYTFPPFATLAPLLSIRRVSSAQLRERERDILRQAVGQQRRLHIRVPGFGWSERLTEVLGLPILPPKPQ